MKKLSFVVLILLFAITACKNNEDKQEKENKVEVEVVAPKQLIVNFNFKTNKADVFKIMMNNIQVDELQKKNIQIFENVIPSSSQDKITAKFEDGNMSKNIVVHLGNKEVKEIEISSVEISYGDNYISIKTPQDLDKYFAFNKFIEKDLTSNKLKTITVNGQHNPVFSFKHNLINFITKE